MAREARTAKGMAHTGSTYSKVVVVGVIIIRGGGGKLVKE